MRHAEDRRICADAQAEREDDYRREAGTFAQTAQSNQQIFPQAFHFLASENQPRRNEGHEERTGIFFVSFVSSWLIFIISESRSLRHELSFEKSWQWAVGSGQS